MAADFTVSADLSYTATPFVGATEYLVPSTVVSTEVIHSYSTTADVDYVGAPLFTGGGGGAPVRPTSGQLFPRYSN